MGRALLTDDGQVLLDGTDISYMYQVKEEGEDEHFDFPFEPDEQYFGESVMHLKYKGRETLLPWVFVDFENLEDVAKRNGFEAILVGDEQFGDEDRGIPYLAKLIPGSPEFLAAPKPDE